VRIGVIGCGAIAQIQHLPNLAELREEFEVAVVCDSSPALTEAVARAFHVPRGVTDYRQVLDADVEAVLLCHTDPKTEVAVAAFHAGKHVFIEKPMCFSMKEADAIIGAARSSGKVAQVGYMKVYDPAFELAKAEVDRIDDVRFIQVNHLHPHNALHLRQFRLLRFDDLPAGASEEIRAARKEAFHDAVGDVSGPAEAAFFTLAGSMIHDFYGLRAMLGLPSGVVSTEIWQDGKAISTVLEYPNGARGVATWVDLPDLWDFKETLEVYGGGRRVVVSYPTGFARGIPSAVAVHGIGADGTPFRKDLSVPWESPFRRELRHFHECIRQGAPTRTPVFSARDDVALIIEIIKRYLRG
jgi:predicted dehydrogenase